LAKGEISSRRGLNFIVRYSPAWLGAATQPEARPPTLKAPERPPGRLFTDTLNLAISGSYWACRFELRKIQTKENTTSGFPELTAPMVKIFGSQTPRLNVPNFSKGHYRSPRFIPTRPAKSAHFENDGLCVFPNRKRNLIANGQFAASAAILLFDYRHQM
jgi:hypothetical protein